MFESVKSIFGGNGAQNDDDDVISPADVAQEVTTVHEKLDDLKTWSHETQQWLETEQDRLAVEGEDELVEEVGDLTMYVSTVAMRIELGDAHLRAQAEDQQEEQPDEEQADEANEDEETEE